MNRFSIGVMATLVCASSTIASAGIGINLLNNAGFEDPLGFDFSNPNNWNGFFGAPAGTFLEAFNTTGAAPRSGSAALVTTIRGVDGVTDGFNSFTGHVQRVDTVTPGVSYELSVWARTNPSVNTGAEFRVEWLNASFGEVGRLNTVIAGSLSSAYQLFSVTSEAPAGAVYANIVLAVQSFDHIGPIADTSVAWDDATFRRVPAPSAAAVLGLGGLLAARRRR